MFIFRQEITQGVRRSTRAVRLAEERLRGLTNMAPLGYLQICSSFLVFYTRSNGFGVGSFTPSYTCLASVQGVVAVNQNRNDETGPVLARTARGIREGIVKGRAILQMFFTLTQFSRIALRYFARRTKR